MGVGQDGMDFIRNIAKEVCQSGLPKKAADYGKRYMRMGDEEIARTVIRKAKNNQDDELYQQIENMVKNGSSTAEIKGAYTDHFYDQYTKDLDSIEDPALRKEADKKARKKAQAKWDHTGYTDYFTKETNGGLSGKRLKGLAAGGLATYAVGSTASRLVGPGTITRDEYGNKDLMGIPFI